MRTLIIVNATVRCVYLICVTAAAISFRKPSILWFYVLGLFVKVSINYTENDIDKEEKIKGGN